MLPIFSFFFPQQGQNWLAEMMVILLGFGQAITVKGIHALVTVASSSRVEWGAVFWVGKIIKKSIEMHSSNKVFYGFAGWSSQLIIKRQK